MSGGLSTERRAGAWVKPFGDGDDFGRDFLTAKAREGARSHDPYEQLQAVSD